SARSRIHAPIHHVLRVLCGGCASATDRANRSRGAQPPTADVQSTRLVADSLLGACFDIDREGPTTVDVETWANRGGDGRDVGGAGGGQCRTCESRGAWIARRGSLFRSAIRRERRPRD